MLSLFYIFSILKIGVQSLYIYHCKLDSQQGCRCLHDILVFIFFFKFSRFSSISSWHLISLPLVFLLIFPVPISHSWRLHKGRADRACLVSLIEHWVLRYLQLFKVISIFMLFNCFTSFSNGVRWPRSFMIHTGCPILFGMIWSDGISWVSFISYFFFIFFLIVIFHLILIFILFSSIIWWQNYDCQ